MTKNASIYTLAEELGINPSSVSRALNNSPKVSLARRKQVMELARERGFKLRAFSSRLTNICALICTHDEREDLFNGFTDEVLNGLREYCAEVDIELSIYGSTIEKLNRINVLKELQRRDVDGAVLINASDDCRFLKKLDEAGFPFCCLMSSPKGYRHRRLEIDNGEMAESACRYLLQLGHRRIGFIFSDSRNRVHQERLAGYRRALVKTGIKAESAWFPDPLETLGGIEQGSAAMARMLRAPKAVTAVLVASEEIAIGAAHAIREHGKRVPEDISLVSFDDSVHARYFNPPLTVLDVPNRPLGRLAARWTHQWIEQNQPGALPQLLESSGQLIVRKSTAPPADA
jgi:LacI family transcriptional regulator